MQALYLKNNQIELLDNYPVPTLQAGEVLVHVTLAGICSTDLELVKGYYPYDGVLGHEFVGVVEQCADTADSAWLGKRVVGTINLSPACGGTCGLRCPEHCPDRTVLGIINKDGVFAQYISLPVQNLLLVPDSVSDEQAVFTEPLAAAARVTEQVAVAGKRAAVIGPGRLGLLVAQVLRHAGADVTVIGRSTPSLQLPQQLGLSIVQGSDNAQAGFDLIVETTASPAGFRAAVDLVRPNGTIVLKSTYAETTDFGSIAPLMAAVVVREITLIGSRCGPFDKALHLLEIAAVDVGCMISAEYPLSEALAAFDYATKKGVRKVLLRP